MEALIEWLHSASLWQALLALLAENALILVLAVALGGWAVRRYGASRVALAAGPLERMEVVVAASSVFFNTVVTITGLFLWRQGIIHFRTDVGVWAWADVLLLVLVMDLAMYVLHRVAHHPWLYPWMHKLHHGYDRVRPLTLFILNPLECLAFGSLWLLVIAAYPFSWLGMSIYLVLNVAFGTIGHLGVEPIPLSWSRVPLVRNFAGSTFHARHHQDLACNFGFYTLIWDRLFGTLRSDYWETIGTVPEWVEVPSRGGTLSTCQDENATR